MESKWWRNSEEELSRVVSRIEKEIKNSSRTEPEVVEPEVVEPEVVEPEVVEPEVVEPEVVEPEVVEPEVVESNSQMNNWIDDSITLINNRGGILRSEIQKIIWSILFEVMSLSIKLIRVNGITGQNIHENGSNFDVLFKKTSTNVGEKIRNSTRIEPTRMDSHWLVNSNSNSTKETILRKQFFD